MNNTGEMYSDAHSPDEDSETREIKTLTEDWYRRVWNERELGAIEELMAEDATIEGIEMLPEGKDGFRRFRNAIWALFRDVHFEVDEIVVGGNRASGLINASAIHRETGNPIRVKISFVSKWKNGQLIKGKNVVDYLGLMKQLGFLDTDDLSSMFRSQDGKQKNH